jgi:hypothetical protein
VLAQRLLCVLPERIDTTMNKLTSVALTAALALGFGSLAPAFAQAPAQQQQQQQRPGRPEFAPTQASGAVARYIVGPMGNVRGFVLDNGAVVMTHGHGDALAQQVRVGQSVRVEGFANPSAPRLIRRATVYGANGAVLIAAPARPAEGFHRGHRGHGGQEGHGRHGRHERGEGRRGGEFREQMRARLAQLPARTANGTVQTVLAGPRGGVRALLLADGTSVFLHPHLSRELRQRGVQSGESVRVAGRGAVYPQGTSMIAERIQFADGTSVSAPLPNGMQP